MTKEILIEALIRNRAWVFKSDYGKPNKWMVYEALFEEGANVKKQLGVFKSEAEANQFLVIFRDELRKYYHELLVVSLNPNCKLPMPTAMVVDRLMEQQQLAKARAFSPEPTRGHEPKTPADDPY